MTDYEIHLICSLYQLQYNEIKSNLTLLEYAIN